MSVQRWAYTILVRTFAIFRTYNSIAELRTKKVADMQVRTLKIVLSQLSARSIFGSVGIRKYLLKGSRIFIWKYYQIRTQTLFRIHIQYCLRDPAPLKEITIVPNRSESGTSWELRKWEVQFWSSTIFSSPHFRNHLWKCTCAVAE